MITQRDIDLWRVEAKGLIRKMVAEWLKNYLGKRVKNVPQLAPKTGY